jgi:DNA-binding PadR family transcriptional regulator
MHRDDAIKLPQRRERTRLRTAVLAALLHDEKGYGYDIADQLHTRMGPSWDIDPKRIYKVLEEFQEDGWAWSEHAQGPGKRGRWRRVYHPTAQAELARAKWIGERLPLEQMRADIRTWVAFARPQDAAEVLRKLGEYETDCLEVLQSSEELKDEPTSWHDRAINVLRNATAEELKAELRWITRARREIREYLAQ